MADVVRVVGEALAPGVDVFGKQFAPGPLEVVTAVLQAVSNTRGEGRHPGNCKQHQRGCGEDVFLERFGHGSAASFGAERIEEGSAIRA